MQGLLKYCMVGIVFPVCMFYYDNYFKLFNLLSCMFQILKDLINNIHTLLTLSVIDALMLKARLHRLLGLLPCQ